MSRGDEAWIFWDFDGTLARRTAGWSECMATVIDRHYPQLQITVDFVRPHFSSGFPWHHPDVPHLDVVDADAWWAAFGLQVAAMLDELGCSDHETRGLLADFRATYTDCDAFILLPGARAVLDELARRGWRQLILSNHVPELPAIVGALGIDDRIDVVLTSATIGYEKPHPEAYRIAVAAAGSPSRTWMIGDSLAADARGPNSVGLASVLVGGAPGRWPHTAGSYATSSTSSGRLTIDRNRRSARSRTTGRADSYRWDAVDPSRSTSTAPSSTK